MRVKGISNQGFKRLAHFVQAQAWGGDELVVTARNHFPLPLGSEGDSPGYISYFSDGGKAYYDWEEVSHIGLLVVNSEGQVIEGQASMDDPSFEEYNRYQTAQDSYGDSAVQGWMTPQDQEEFNQVMGTSYDIVDVSNTEAYPPLENSF